MSNQELINAGTKTMDETDQAIERSKKVKLFADFCFPDVCLFCFLKCMILYSGC